MKRGAARKQDARPDVPMPKRTVATVDEGSLIGAIVATDQAPQLLAELRAEELADSFLDPQRRDLWRAIIALWKRGTEINMVTLVDEVRARPDVYGAVQATEVAEWTLRVDEEWFAPVAAVQYHADRVREAAARRRLITMANALAGAAAEDPRTVGEWLPDLVSPLANVRVRMRDPSWSNAVLGAVMAIEERSRKQFGNAIPTGLTQIDTLTGGGLGRGHLVSIGARPSIGKTALALSMVDHQISRDIGVGVCSLEMSRGELIERLIAKRTGLNLLRIRNGWLHEGDWAKVNAAAEALAQCPLEIEAEEKSWPQIEAAMMRMAGHGAQVLYLDYLGLLHVPGDEPRWERMQGVTAALKRMAKTLQVPVVLLNQINREGVKDKDKRPHLWHLRETGGVEQDSDDIMLLHRPGYYSAHEPKDLAEVNIAKQRNGPIGEVKLTWTGATASFADWPEYDTIDD